MEKVQNRRTHGSTNIPNNKNKHESGFFSEESSFIGKEKNRKGRKQPLKSESNNLLSENKQKHM